MFCLNAAAMGLCIAYFVILYGNGKDEVNNHYKIIDNCLDVESQKILTDFVKGTAFVNSATITCYVLLGLNILIIFIDFWIWIKHMNDPWKPESCSEAEANNQVNPNPVNVAPVITNVVPVNTNMIPPVPVTTNIITVNTNLVPPVPATTNVNITRNTAAVNSVNQNSNQTLELQVVNANPASSIGQININMDGIGTFTTKNEGKKIAEDYINKYQSYNSNNNEEEDHYQLPPPIFENNYFDSISKHDKLDIELNNKETNYVKLTGNVNSDFKINNDHDFTNDGFINVENGGNLQIFLDTDKKLKLELPSINQLDKVNEIRPKQDEELAV